ncbi:MAG TPA: glycoside hydrolase family 9 protein [Bryobacteraceae bacterium]|nr:glycoside hydrolase family 9 protein [Bryobacteraceae bacterium]
MSRQRQSVLLALFLTLPVSGGDFLMQVTDNGYLNTQGFSVILYKDTFHPVFVDEKKTAMEMILHGQRIATNGDVRLVPTPEQWDLVAKLNGQQVDKEHNRLTAQLSFPSYEMNYRLEVAAEPGGVRVSIDLEKPLPEKLAGRAGFNLEFLPSIYVGKSFAVDGNTFGMMPRSPQDPMQKVLPSPDDPKKLPYQEQWDKDKGYTQPLPFVTGNRITLAAEDPQYRISISSENGPLSLYDGRNRAQNGWFVLRTLIPSGKTEGAVVWHIHPDVIPNWTRPPVVAHSQAGYAPNFPKVAVIELDPKFDAPKTAKVLRLGEDGSYRQVFEGPLSTPRPWLRYTYAKFDFSLVKEPGLYVIEYAGQKTDLFPIARDVYSRTWQSSLDGFLAVEMDHVSVREGYRLWHGVSHLDDARQAPPNTQHFDGYRMGPNLDSPYKPGEHIPGLNVGGWFDAGDYDNIAPSQYSVIQDLALAYQEFDLKWDQLSVDETAREVEMHRPDGVPDAVQQVKHGILQVLAQIKAIGHPIMGIIEPNLRGYTHLGDAASNTDGRIYSAKLGPNEVDGNFSGKPDDRWAFTTKNAGLQYGATAALAAASRVLKGWDDPLAKECLDTAVRLWNEEHANPTPMPQGREGGFVPAGMGGAMDWNAAVELLITTNGAEPYKKRVLELFPTIKQRFGFNGWIAVRALPYMDAEFHKQLEEVVKDYVVGLDADLAKTPFGVPPSLRTWGGSASVAELGVRMYFLHKAFPEIVGTDYTLRAANYLLGTHPVSSTSYISSVGTVSKMKAYGNNRADGTFIPGGMIPGYILIQPDFPECIDDFGFLWFEDEYTISVAAKWILAANAADALVK